MNILENYIEFIKNNWKIGDSIFDRKHNHFVLDCVSDDNYIYLESYHVPIKRIKLKICYDDKNNKIVFYDEFYNEIIEIKNHSFINREISKFYDNYENEIKSKTNILGK